MRLPNLSKLCLCDKRPESTSTYWDIITYPDGAPDGHRVWGERCPICQDRLDSEFAHDESPLPNRGRAIVMCCLGHVIHEQCYNDWVNRGETTCPTCRVDLRQQSELSASTNPPFRPRYLDGGHQWIGTVPGPAPPPPPAPAIQPLSIEELNAILTDGAERAAVISAVQDIVSMEDADARIQDLRNNLIGRPDLINTPLQLAVDAGGSDDGPEAEPILVFAARVQNMPIFRLLLTDPIIRQTCSKNNFLMDVGETALYHAVQENNPEMVRLLLDDVDPSANVQTYRSTYVEMNITSMHDDSDTSPFLRAVADGSWEIAMLMLEKYRDTDADPSTPWGGSPQPDMKTRNASGYGVLHLCFASDADDDDGTVEDARRQFLDAFFLEDDSVSDARKGELWSAVGMITATTTDRYCIPVRTSTFMEAVIHEDLWVLGKLLSVHKSPEDYAIPLAHTASSYLLPFQEGQCPSGHIPTDLLKLAYEKDIELQARPDQGRYTRTIIERCGDRLFALDSNLLVQCMLAHADDDSMLAPNAASGLDGWQQSIVSSYLTRYDTMDNLRAINNLIHHRRPTSQTFIPPSKKKTTLYILKELGSTPGLDLISERGGIANPALFMAMDDNDRELFDVLLTMPSINVNKRKRRTYNSRTVLMEAVALGNEYFVKRLLEHESIDVSMTGRIEYPEVREVNGNNPAHFLSECKDVEAALKVLEVIVKDGRINLNAPNADGETPLILVVKQCSTFHLHELLVPMMDAGANPLKSDNDGNNAFYHAELADCDYRVREDLEEWRKRQM